MTSRELEILSFVALGETDKLIATRLEVSDSTVKNHLRSAYRKLDVNDRTSAVLLALRFGWLKIPEEGQMNISLTDVPGTSKDTAKTNKESPDLNHETLMRS